MRGGQRSTLRRGTGISSEYNNKVIIRPFLANMGKTGKLRGIYREYTGENH